MKILIKSLIFVIIFIVVFSGIFFIGSLRVIPCDTNCMYGRDTVYDLKTEYNKYCPLHGMAELNIGADCKVEYKNNFLRYIFQDYRIFYELFYFIVLPSIISVRLCFFVNKRISKKWNKENINKIHIK